MTQPTIRREDLISRRAAAQALGIHANTLDKAAAAAGMKKHHVLGDTRVFYLRAEIETIEVVREVPS